MVFQVRPAPLLPSLQLPEWERKRGHAGAWSLPFPPPLPVCIPAFPRTCPCSPGAQDQTTATPKPVLLPKAQAERGFHVFYELLAGLDPAQREQLSLQGPETYYYLNQVGAGLAWGKVWKEWPEGREAMAARPCPLTPAVLCRARPAGSRARMMPRTSKDF